MAMLLVSRLGDSESSPFAVDIRNVTKAALERPVRVQPGVVAVASFHRQRRPVGDPELMSLTAKFA
jgi:hypothetical protein